MKMLIMNGNPMILIGFCLWALFAKQPIGTGAVPVKITDCPMCDHGTFLWSSKLNKKAPQREGRIGERMLSNQVPSLEPALKL